MSVLKQLYINSIKLPKEIIDIIKSYTFIDIIILQKIRKKIIVNLIQQTKWTYKDMNTQNRLIFWIESDTKCPQYQIIFCYKCGNYQFYCANNYDKINCKCILI